MSVSDAAWGVAMGLIATTTGTPPPVVSPMDISKWDLSAWIAVAGVITSAVLAYTTFRKGKSDEVSAAADVKVKLDAMIDARVERNLTAAWSKIDELEGKVKDLEGVREENAQIKDIVRRHFVKLIDWDSRGHRGPMPLPDVADVELLGLDHPISDTLTKQQRDDAVSSESYG